MIIGTRSGSRATFQQRGGVYILLWPRSGSRSTLTSAAGVFEYRPGGSDVVEKFESGRLVELRRRSANSVVQFSYDNSGLPATIRDADGTWQWNITTDAATRRITAIAVNGRADIVWQYIYDAAGNLQSVIAPGGGVWRTYEYSNGRLSAAKDAAGNLIESHDYAASGKGLLAAAGGQLDAAKFL